ncbi:iron chaperone [Dyadobacter luticola]|uniref:DUF1801 domain-containing protein n=1 Tax=Dyadobacter luticola TaxID=1979387 RepID=A0A5R9L641_9BACT|nr:DUF1801 domain-containing protein [Dyadobacter luticola]TLV03750.1 DUF1801 domain-containing protein [Dyadobacter luticola]
MTTQKPTTVDEYIARFPADVQPVLSEVRAAILDVIPDAEERISYDMPTFYMNGSYVIYFAGWKKHIALYPIIGIAAEKLQDELAGYKGSKSSVHFPLNKPMPIDLIKKIVKVKLEDSRQKKK